MKRLILMLIMLISVTAFAQPKSKKETREVPVTYANKAVEPKLDVVEVQGVYRTDTLDVKITIEDEEGYLKRVVGKMVVRSFTPVQGNPQAIEQKYYDSGWKQIPLEKVDRWIQIPAAIPEQKSKN